eukprot:TRINITY_DN19243_c0_g1_i1.p1 TRINITY_DN19243_c0_g1~~TRINITY_DN19243_c0_g1_i1.p1  ORF type:complete len:141 (-),score=24.20 TRINITY_DN19243_c0_g1_i1:59-481(-)
MGTQLLRKITATGILNEIFDLIRDKAGEPETNLYKMVLINGHYEMLASLVAVFYDDDQIARMDDAIPPFASLFTFELHAEEGLYWVEAKYNDNPVMLKVCRGSIRCSLNDFLSYLDPFIIVDINVLCDVPEHREVLEVSE